jgi:hypothetical protein
MEEDSFSNYSATSLSSRFMQTSWEDGYNRRLFFIRLGLISVTMIAVVANALTGYAIQDEKISCIWDGLFKITDNINIYLADHDQTRNFLLIISSSLVDFLLVIFATRWVLLGTTWRPVIFLFMFYLFRGIVQVIYK